MNLVNYDNLTLAHVGEFMKQYPEIYEWLPEVKDWSKCEKKYFCVICNTVKHTEFQKWYTDRQNERDEYLAKKRGQMIKMKRSTYKAIEKSKHVSGKYNKQHLLLIYTFVIIFLHIEL